jgi:histidine triad (HIT) family protein
MKDCIFCKIIKGKIPCYKVYEDKNVLAFLDVNPANPGHTLVVPKKHSANMYEAKDAVVKKLIIAVKNLAPKIKQALNAKTVHITIAGDDVPHTHIHIIPRFENDGIKWPEPKKYKEGEAEAVANKIKNLLK